MKRRPVLAAAVWLIVGVHVGAVQVRPAAAIVPGPPLTCPTRVDIDFGGTEYADCFRDVLRGSEINVGVDLGTAGHTSLNFTGSTGPAATWLTVYEHELVVPPDEIDEPLRPQSFTVCADVLLERFNNTKGAGVAGMFQEGVGRQGVALIVYDAGNTDTLALVTVDGDPAGKGKLTTLQSVSLKGKIAEKAWYRVVLEVLVARDVLEAFAVEPLIIERPPLQIGGGVWSHVDPSNPDSDLGAQIGSTLLYEPLTPPPGLTPFPEGQMGLIGTAVASAVNASITNFRTDPRTCRNRRPPDRT